VIPGDEQGDGAGLIAERAEDVAGLLGAGADRKAADQAVVVEVDAEVGGGGLGYAEVLGQQALLGDGAQTLVARPTERGASGSERAAAPKYENMRQRAVVGTGCQPKMRRK
jgi:hypothetical protein